MERQDVNRSNKKKSLLWLFKTDNWIIIFWCCPGRDIYISGLCIFLRKWTLSLFVCGFKSNDWLVKWTENYIFIIRWYVYMVGETTKIRLSILLQHNFHRCYWLIWLVVIPLLVLWSNLFSNFNKLYYV